MNEVWLPECSRTCYNVMADEILVILDCSGIDCDIFLYGLTNKNLSLVSDCNGNILIPH